MPKRFLSKCISDLLDFVSVHLWVLLAITAGFWMIWYVPQISNLWQQRPFGRIESLGFGLLLLLLVWLYPVTLFWLWQRTLLEVWKPDWRNAVISWCRKWRWFDYILRLVFAPSRILTRALHTVASSSVGLANGGMGVLAIIAFIVCGFTLTHWVPVELHRPYLMFGGYLRMIGLWLILVGIWLAFGKWFGATEMIQRIEIDRSASDDPVERRRRVWHAAGRVLSWMAGVSFFGEFLWIGAALEVPIASFRLYSIWAAIHIPVVVAVLAALVDFTQQHTHAHARMIVGVLLIARIAFPYYIESNTVRDRVPPIVIAGAVKQGTAQGGAWLDAFEQRIDEIPRGPVVVVAASGGGSRAALFASLVLQHLATQPMDWIYEADLPADAPGSSGPSTSGQLEQSVRKSMWADHILVMSSVSGGSLATGRFAADPGIAQDRLSDLRNSTKEELRLRTLAKVQGWLGPGKPDANAASSAASDADELNRLRLVESELKDLGSQNGTSAAAIAFSSKIADDMAADFMAPILRGVLIPNSTRGDCLYHFWEHQFGWDNEWQQSGVLLSDHERVPSGASMLGTTPESQPDVSESALNGPLVLFNTTDVETGRRVILGFPSLPNGFLASAPEFPAEILDSTGTQTRGKEFGPVSLADFSPVDITRVSLTRAVRLSSNFPWGFGVQQFNSKSSPPTKMQAKAPSVRGENTRTKIELVDGGVVDNTGIDSLSALFETLFILAEDNPFGREAGILQKLRKRGIAFIEIDSGAKPTGNASEQTAFGDILRPLTALNNSSYTNALRISDNLIQRLTLRFAISPSAAQLSAFPLSKDNPYFKLLTEEQLKGALPVAIPANSDAEKAIVSLFHFRFSCNHVQDTNADVMTAFALGPDDKATVMAMFLSEVQKWEEWQSGTHDAYSFVQSYFAPKSPQSLTEEFAEHLAFHLIDRTQAELRILEERASNGETLSGQEQRQSLQRIVTLLLGLRSVSDIPSVSNEKTNMWSKLAEVTRYLQDTQLASVSAPATPDPSESLPDPPVSSLQPEVQVQLNEEKLNVMLQSTQDARQEVASVAQDSSVTEKSFSEPPVTRASPSYGSGSSSKLSTPFLRDVLRRQSNAAKDAANQSKFFEAKK